jgi:hypothetical protein
MDASIRNAGGTGLILQWLEEAGSRCQEAMLMAGRSVRRWCPVPDKFMAAPLSRSIA